MTPSPGRSDNVASPADAAARTRDYGRGATLLTAGFAATGLASFGFFSLASHALGGDDYKRVVLLWSLTFIGVGVIYRPIEQLIARGIGGDRNAASAGLVRTAVSLQATFALVFLVAALLARGRITNGLFDGSSALFWILVGSVTAFAVSYVARGWLAGHGRFALYGALITVEALARLLFPFAVIVGLGGGKDVVGLGVLAAPLVSLIVVPIAVVRNRRGTPPEAAPESATGLTEGGYFALGAFGVLLAEQTLLNAGILIADAKSADNALAGNIFNALLIARAPLLLFIAVQASLLPHLAGLADDAAAFAHAVRTTILATLTFGVAVALGLLAIGPPFMDAFFGGGYHYGRGGLALIGLAVGCHLAASTLTQAALARGRAAAAGGLWLIAGAAFVVWMILAGVSDLLLRVEIGYAGAAALLLALVYSVLGREPG
jgi:O-antigen/teichoic acid export membrane protein